MDLTGKGVFLTGGARGIGRGMTEALLEKGAKVLFCDILADAGNATEQELQKQYGPDNVFFRQCDVTDADQLKEAFEAAVSKFGAVDICVNNAGILNEINWERTIAINTVAQIRGCQLALEHMRRDKGGRGGTIVYTVSIGGLCTQAFIAPVYNASKHAMIGFMTSWAKNPKMAEMGVTWRALCPDVVPTGLVNWEHLETQIADVEEMRKLIRQSVEKGTEITLQELVEAFLKMLQDDKSTDVIFEVRKARLGAFRKRLLVDSDGASNVVMAD